MAPVTLGHFEDDRVFARPGAEGMSIPAHCHPKIRAIFDYWRAVHPAVGLPGRQHIDPVDIRSLLPNVWLMDVLRDPVRFRLRLLGTRIVAYAGEDNTGKWVHELWPDSNVAPLREVVETGHPILWRGPSHFRPEKSYFELERIRLPLARDGVTVDMIFGLTVFYDQKGKEVLTAF